MSAVVRNTITADTKRFEFSRGLSKTMGRRNTPPQELCPGEIPKRITNQKK